MKMDKRRVHDGRWNTAPKVDMFEMLAKERLQLSLTLEQGVDRISVYTDICKESWPAGMVPGYSMVQVTRMVCSGTSSNSNRAECYGRRCYDLLVDDQQEAT